MKIIMKEKLSFRYYILVGSLLFGLFFGAGNLIFPVKMGQSAGSNTLPATIGFLITGVGLPVLGVIASALSKSESLYDMAKPVSSGYSVFFTCALYLTIGPYLQFRELPQLLLRLASGPSFRKNIKNLDYSCFH